MINRTVLVGRITKEPEVKFTSSNIAFVKFTLAVNRTYGEKETDFIQCMTWRKQAENMGTYVKKGMLLGIEGRIQTGSYDNKDGNRVYTTDVICDSVQFLESKNTKPKEDNPLAKNEAQKEYDNQGVDTSQLPF